MLSRFITKRSFHASSNRLARILATDKVDQVCVDVFKSRGHEVDLVPTMPADKLVEVIGEYDGLVVRSATKVNAQILQAAKKMRVVGRAGVGVDNIDLKEATKQGIMVMNTPNGNTVSTAQLAMSLLCNMARRIPAANMSVKSGKWTPKEFKGTELQGKTLGVVGCGRIGQVMSQLAKSMGMAVLGYDPVLDTKTLDSLGIRKASLETIWAHSDFITVHTPLTPDTTNLINDTTLAQCKKGVGIVNCARGGIIDEEALLRALESGQVSVAALDVYTSEPPKDNLKPLIAHPNLVCTPHLGASTDEAQVNVARDIATQMCDVFDQRDFVGIVNVPYISASTQTHMKPFMALAELLGSVASQMSEGRVVRLETRTWGGRDASITTPIARQLIEAMALQGMIKNGYMFDKVTPDLISAPIIAKEADISTIIVQDPPVNVITEHYRNLVSITVTWDNGQRNVVTGSVFGTAPYIVNMDTHYDAFTFKPDGNYLLLCKNEDRPGAVSKILDMLHSADVNIANVNLIRAKDASPADSKPQQVLGLYSLDNDIPARVMTLLKGLDGIHDVSKIRLK